jgi:hypothetical protein
VLRLWPDRSVIFLFPDATTLYRSGGQAVVRSMPSDSGVELIDGLGALLDGIDRAHSSRLEIVISDSAARLTALPWQDSLKGDDQRAAYARACFSQAGFELDEDYLVQAAFRRFRGFGLGYALPRLLVAEVDKCLRERGVRLTSIMPLSAYAYWFSRRSMRGGRTALLFRERNRLSVLLFDENKCEGIHAQPMGAGVADTARRLWNMVELSFPSVSHIQYWSAEDGEAEARLIEERLAGPSVESISQLGWN